MGGLFLFVLLLIVAPVIILVVYHQRLKQLEKDSKRLSEDVLFLKRQFYKTGFYPETEREHAEEKIVTAEKTVAPVPVEQKPAEDDVTTNVYVETLPIADTTEQDIEVIISKPFEPASIFNVSQPYIEESYEDEISEVISAPEIKPEIQEALNKSAVEDVLYRSKAAHTVPPATTEKVKETKSWWSGKEIESLIGGKLLNRIGSLALIIGIGFFLKYAFDRNWISEWMRVGIGFISGFGLIAGGWQFNKKDYKIFSQGLIGSGIAVLFLSVFASFNFYHLVPQMAAFAMMSAITAFTFWLGIKYNSIAVAILGWLGGFLTPFLLSTGQANEIGLFTYIALLDIGLLFIFIKKSSWQFFYPMILLGTYIIYYAWFYEYFKSDSPDVSLITSCFLTIFWLLFVLVELYSIYPGKIKNNEVFTSINAISLIIYYINLYIVFDKYFHVWMGFATVVIACIYFGMMRLSYLKNKDDIMRNNILMISTIILILLSTFIQFKDYITVAILSGEAVIFLYFGLNKELKVLKKFTMITIALAIIKLLIMQFTNYTDMYVVGKITVGYQFDIILLNMKALGIICIAISSYLCSYMLKRKNEPHYLKIAAIYDYTWSIALFYLILNEINSYHGRLMWLKYGKDYTSIVSNQMLTNGFSSIVYGISLLYYGLRTKTNPAVIVSLFFATIGIGITVLGGFEYEIIEPYSILLNYRFLSFIIAIISLAGIYYLIKKNQNYSTRIASYINTIFVSMIIMLVLLIYHEINGYYFHLAFLSHQCNLESINFSKNLTLAFSFLIFTIPLIYYSFGTKTNPGIVLALVIMGIGVLIAVFAGYSIHPIDKYSLIFNYRFMSYLIVIISLGVIYLIARKNNNYIQWMNKAVIIIFITLILMILILIIGEITDYHSHLLYLSHNFNSVSIYFNRNLTYAFSLLLYSLPLIYYGFLTKTNSAVIVALYCIPLGIVISVAGGFSFEPVNQYMIVLNYRFMSCLIVIISLAIILLITNKNKNYSEWMGKATGAMFISFILLIVILISAETNDNYNQIITNLHKYFMYNGNPSEKWIGSEMQKFGNIQQLALSGIWIIYSILMLIIGIWRRMKLLRLISIVLFGITILKVFIFDLSFLETLYRIFSFIALGIILLMVSYLYQRYKNIILEK